MTSLRLLLLLVRRVYHVDPGRMTWRAFATAAENAEAFVRWEQGKGPCPAAPAAPTPDAGALGL